jgi:hypothetical protein
VCHPGLAELYYQEEEMRISDGKDNNPVILTTSGLITEMNLNRRVIEVRSTLDLSQDEYLRKRAKYLENVQGLNQGQ